MSSRQAEIDKMFESLNKSDGCMHPTSFDMVAEYLVDRGFRSKDGFEIRTTVYEEFRKGEQKPIIHNTGNLTVEPIDYTNEKPQ